MGRRTWGPSIALGGTTHGITPLELAVVRDGTGTRARVSGAAVRGKIGTSDDGADGWFVSGDASLLAAVWVGEPDGRIARPEASGVTVAAPLWREAVGDALSGHAS